MTALADRLLDWFDLHGRHDLPWLSPRNPYRVWLSEVMLQQTQVSSVIGYFQRFVAALPDVAALAQAPLDQVLGLWSGLGYYSRARNLHRAAQRVMTDHGGELPADFDRLLALPGIGRSTAGAILAQAFGQRAAILDGNVRRVLARLDGISEFPGLPAVEKRLWSRAEALLPHTRLADYTQALMDLGATLCTPRQPRCGACPWADDCIAHALQRTGTIPAARPRKVVPERSCHWLWLADPSGRVLLERRPPSGIWGGLWSLPEAADPLEWCTRFGLSLARLHQLGEVRHVFTHFKLRAQVWRCDWLAAGLREAPGEAWFSAGELGSLGLPAPVRRLLEPRTSGP